MAHADLEVLIQRWSDGGYAVDMRFRTADGQADTELALNVPIKLDLAALLERSNDPQAYGHALTGMFFADQRLLNAFLRVRGFVEGADIPLRLRMRLDPEAPELHAVRWESFFDPDRNEPIARGELVMLSRYLDSANLARLTVPARDEIKALVAVANPRDLAKFKLQPFDGDAEAERVRKALGNIPAATLVTGPGQPPVSLNAICDALRFGYSILYLVCHGVLRDGQPMLYLEGDDGAAAWVPGDELARKIADLSPALRPLLVVLASCQSVGVGQGSTVPSALGPRLARAGVGAVVGMQGDVPMDLVADLMPRFFGQLAESGEIDRALAVGRAGLAADSPWWMPVLFLRLRDGRLWQAAVAKPAEPAPPPPPAVRRLTPALAWAGGAILIVLLLGVALAQLLRPAGNPTGAQQQIAAAITAAPTATLAPPTATPIPSVEPVGAGKYMILVADLEPAAPTSRDYARDIYDDLKQNLEQIPFSDMQIRRYRGVVTSDEQARAVAEQAGAAVIIWGRYDESRIDLEVQAGDRSRFPGIPKEIDDATLARTGNLSLRLPTSGQLKSSALAALTPLNVLKSADGDSFAVLRQSAIQDQILRKGEMADVQGQSSATWAYGFLFYFYSQPEQALAGLRTGLANDPGNPILLLYRGITYQRMNNIASADEDAKAALRAAPGWATPYGIEAVTCFSRNDLSGSISALDHMQALRPNDWFAYSYRGGIKYLLGDVAAAKADLDQSIKLDPLTSQPYAYATIIALREGRISDSQALIRQVRERFSKTAGFDSAFYASLLGVDNPMSLATSAFDQLGAGQYGDAISIIDKGLAMVEGSAQVPPVVPGDLLFMRGFAQCNRSDDAGANDSYTQALSFSPDFMLLHLLRADVRARLGDLTGVQADLSAAAANEQLKPLVEAIQAGQLTLSCKTLLN